MMPDRSAPPARHGAATMGDVLFLTRYGRMGASSRYRFLQYVPALEAAGLTVHVSPLFDDRYLADRYAGRRALSGQLRALGTRIGALRKLDRHALVVVEKELLPFAPLLVETPWLSRPFVLDYDDAIFHQYDRHASAVVRWALGRKIPSLMRRASLVIAGNRYLAHFATRAGAERVAVVPTVVDPSGCEPRTERSGGVFTIGWIGSPSTSGYLGAIAPALAAVCADGRARVLLVGAGDVTLPGVPVERLPWSEETEARDIGRFDVGIMPLPDEPWAHGKCGFKLIQYMAHGLPVVASPVGANREIVDSTCGVLAAGPREWTNALRSLRADPALRREMGAAGRARVEARYSLAVTAPIVLSLIRRELERRSTGTAAPARAPSPSVAMGGSR